MTKKEIVRKIAAEFHLGQSLVHDIVQRALDEIVDAMIREGRIELRNFGVFEMRVRAPRKARNPQTNERLEVPQRVVVTFKPGKEMAGRAAAIPPDRLVAIFREQLSKASGEVPPPDVEDGEQPRATETPGC